MLQEAEKVAKSLMSLQERLFSLLQQVDELSGQTHKQLGSLYRAEVGLQKMERTFADAATHHICSSLCRQVDLDIKMRNCAGSCRSLEPFSADHEGYRALESDMEQMDQTLSGRRSRMRPPNGIPQVRLQNSAQISSPPDGTKQQRELLMQLQPIGQKLIVLDPPPEQN